MDLGGSVGAGEAELHALPVRTGRGPGCSGMGIGSHDSLGFHFKIGVADWVLAVTRDVSGWGLENLIGFGSTKVRGIDHHLWSYISGVAIQVTPVTSGVSWAQLPS